MPSPPQSSRRRRFAPVIPALLGAWVVVAGLPMAPQAGSPGRLESSEIVLAGPKAVAVAPALDEAAPVPPAPTTEPGTTDPGTTDPDATDPGTTIPGTTIPGEGAPTPPAPTPDAEPAPRTTRGAAGQGWSAAVDLDDGTQMVALSWDDTPSAQGATVAVRGRTDGAWSEWQTLGVDTDEGPDPDVEPGNGRTGIGPVWLGPTGADDVEVQLTSGTVTNLSMLKMRWIDPTPGQGQRADAEPAGPGIRPRSEWAPGGWEPDNEGCTPAPIVMDQLKFAVVHHTVNANTYTASQVPGILAGLYRYHVGSNGWCDVAYNFFIDRFGTVWQGRSGNIANPIMGGHAKGFNTDSVGVAFLGQYEPNAAPAAAQPTAAALASLKSLLAWKLSIHGVNPTGTVSVVSKGSTRYPEGQRVTIPTIVGHKDVGLTACPGRYLYDLLPTVRRDVASQIAGAATPAAWAPFPDPRNLANRQYLDFLGRSSTNTDRAYWASRMQRDKVTPEAQIATILDADELQSKSGAVTRLYLAYFGRIPDHDGLTFWINRVRGRHSTVQGISDYFAGSTEFRSTYGNLSNADFVTRVYRNVLGRDPDASGLRYWSGQLDNRTRTRGSVMLGFSESSENRWLTRNNVAVILTHEAMLERSISPTSYFTWVTNIGQQGGSISTLIDRLLGSAEYARRVKG